MLSPLAEVLRAAMKTQNGFERADGEFYMGSAGSVNVDQLVEAVAAAGLAVIQLPEVRPAPVVRDSDGCLAVIHYGRFGSLAVWREDPDEEPIITLADGGEMNAEGAHELAAALLAAAAKAVSA
jgi:hypothetical protein